MLPPPLPSNGSLPSSPRPAQAMLGDNTGVGIGPGQYTHDELLLVSWLTSHLRPNKTPTTSDSGRVAS